MSLLVLSVVCDRLYFAPKNLYISLMKFSVLIHVCWWQNIS